MITYILCVLMCLFTFSFVRMLFFPQEWPYCLMLFLMWVVSNFWSEVDSKLRRGFYTVDALMECLNKNNDSENPWLKSHRIVETIGLYYRPHLDDPYAVSSAYWRRKSVDICAIIPFYA